MSQKYDKMLGVGAQRAGGLPLPLSRIPASLTSESTPTSYMAQTEAGGIREMASWEPYWSISLAAMRKLLSTSIPELRA
jgi:hypothetical protein